MKQIITLALLLITFSGWSQQNDSVKKVLQKIVTHTEVASIYRNKVNWDSLKTQIFLLAKDANTVSELSPALTYLLKSLGDEHGRIFYRNQMLAYYYGELKEHQKNFNSQTYGQIQSGQVYYFDAKLLNENIGYLRIVGLPMGDNQLMAKAIQDKVCELIGLGAEKWILDLRYNGGGNMHPMAEGIAELIGNGYAGGSEGLTKSENSIWTVKQGDFYYDDYSIQLKNDCKLTTLPKVAVLTSVYTASSGEAIAVIFKGRENTRFFGENTLGMITVTDWYVVNEETTMTIAVSYYVDRKGKVYKNYVDVEEETPFVNEPLSEKDIAIPRAILWLEEK